MWFNLQWHFSIWTSTNKYLILNTPGNLRCSKNDPLTQRYKARRNVFLKIWDFTLELDLNLEFNLNHVFILQRHPIALLHCLSIIMEDLHRKGHPITETTQSKYWRALVAIENDSWWTHDEKEAETDLSHNKNIYFKLCSWVFKLTKLVSHWLLSLNCRTRPYPNVSRNSWQI